MTDINKFIVKREQWLRGTYPSMLRNAEGKMCCLGFCAMQLFDYPSEKIEDVGMPWEFDTDENYEETWGTIGFEERLDFMSQVNDNPDSSDDEKEKDLTKLFQDVGIEIQFVG